jgi:hypothetical protein
MLHYLPIILILYADIDNLNKPPKQFIKQEKLDWNLSYDEGFVSLKVYRNVRQGINMKLAKHTRRCLPLPTTKYTLLYHAT